MSIEDLRRTLHEHAEDGPAAGAGRVTAHQRTTAVLRRARVLRRRRTVGVSALAACAVVGVVGVLAPQSPGDRPQQPAATSPSPSPTPGETATPTPLPDLTFAGWTYPRTLEVEGKTYGFTAAYESAPGRRVLRVEADEAAAATPRALAYSTSSSNTSGVTVTIDGEEMAGDSGGALLSGLLLTPGRSHTVVVRAPGLAADEQIALAVYDLER